VAAWEALRLIKQLGLRPRRTIRVVLWTNEESGLAGGREYASAHGSRASDIVFAMESDNGVFTPKSVRVAGPDSIIQMLGPVVAPLARIGVVGVERGEPEADVSPLFALGVPAVSVETDASKYFWYHHTRADTPDKIDPHQMALCVAALAAIAYGAAW